MTDDEINKIMRCVCFRAKQMGYDEDREDIAQEVLIKRIQGLSKTQSTEQAVRDAVRVLHGRKYGKEKGNKKGDRLLMYEGIRRAKRLKSFHWVGDDYEEIHLKDLLSVVSEYATLWVLVGCFIWGCTEEELASKGKCNASTIRNIRLKGLLEIKNEIETG